jgi:O-antigen/teichoic acid export membrane protein
MKFHIQVRGLLEYFTVSRVGRNIFANYVGSLVTATVPLIALPFLLRALGREYWGLVSFATLMVTVMAVLNVGMSQSLVKEFGSRWSAGKAGRDAAAVLLYGYERIYWALALVIALVAMPFAGLIVSHWLNAGSIPREIATGTVYCAVVLFFVQLPSALYGAVLSSLQEQVKQNWVRTVFTLIKGIGGVLIASQTHSVLSYLQFLIIGTFAETLTLAYCSWSLMPQSRARLCWNAKEVKSGLQFSAALSAMVILGVLTTQIDKFYVSLKLPLEQLGYYSIGYSLAMGVLQLSYPIFTAALPRLVEIADGHAERRRMNMTLLGLAGAFILSGGCLYALIGRPLLAFWLGDVDLAMKVAAVLDWMLLANALNMVYNIGYINWISLGETRLLAIINVVSFTIAIFLAPRSIDTFGLTGAAVSLVAINLIGSVCSIIWLFRTNDARQSAEAAAGERIL